MTFIIKIVDLKFRGTNILLHALRSDVKNFSQTNYLISEKKLRG